MLDLPNLIRDGASSTWLFVPTAILLGALHGLEPGHSKTMMAAFIIAVRGTVRQAVLLGLAATVSHTLVVWAVALGGMKLFVRTDAAASEPWFQMISGLLIVVLALWMLWRTRREQAHLDHHHHDHDHHHDEDDPDKSRLELATGGRMDAHELAHARDIQRRFADRTVTTQQIILFGLTGGVMLAIGVYVTIAGSAHLP